MSDAGAPGLPVGTPLESLSYEQLVETLEALARRMSAGEVGIEEAAELYQQAGAIHRLANQRLEQVRRRIEDLDGEGGPGDTASKG